MVPSIVTINEAWGFFQVFLRVAALFSVAPVFGSREVPAPVRVLLALALSAIVYPQVSGALAPIPNTLLEMIGPVVRETLVGLALGMLVSLLFTAATVAGDLLDLQMGFNMAAVFNPALGAQVAMMSQFLYRYTLVVFLLLNGHHVLLAGVARSFTALPAARFSLATDAAALRLAGDLATTIVGAGLRIAAPALATLLLVDIALALVSRAAPQVNVFQLGMPIKIVVGLVMVVGALGLMTTVLQNFAAGATREALGGLLPVLGR